MNNVNLFTAALAGLVSFLSPCVLPLIPGYISFISGISLQDLREAAPSKGVLLRTFVRSLWFVLGFSLVFIALGASATALGQLFLQKLDLFKQAAGVVIIVFGLHLTGIVRVPFLQYEKKMEIRQKPMGVIGAFLVGAAFAFGWTPCIGPILSTILALAAYEGTVSRGMLLLGVYSLGLGIPFLLTSILVPIFFRVFGWLRRFLRVMEVMSGVLLIAIGILILTNRLAALASSLSIFHRFSL